LKPSPKFVILVPQTHISEKLKGKMKYLVTGGSGFLGINLIRYLHSRGHQIKSLDLVYFDYQDINNKIETITGYI